MPGRCAPVGAASRPNQGFRAKDLEVAADRGAHRDHRLSALRKGGGLLVRQLIERAASGVSRHARRRRRVARRAAHEHVVSRGRTGGLARDSDFPVKLCAARRRECLVQAIPKEHVRERVSGVLTPHEHAACDGLARVPGNIIWVKSECGAQHIRSKLASQDGGGFEHQTSSGRQARQMLVDHLIESTMQQALGRSQAKQLLDEEWIPLACPVDLVRRQRGARRRPGGDRVARQPGQ